MDRPDSHVTNDRGEIQMRTVFTSAGWAVNKLESDYGIDFDVEIFKEHKSTGEWFKVQLKSSESTQYSADGSFVSESLSSAHATHYSAEINDPCLVIHADVTTGRTFWFAPQLTTLANKLGESVTFRIPTQNELPHSLPDLELCVEKIRLKLARRGMVRQSAEDLNSLVSQARVLELFNDLIVRTATAIFFGSKSADVLKIQLEFVKGAQHQIDPVSQYYEFDFIGSANVIEHTWPRGAPPGLGLPPEEAKLAWLARKPVWSEEREIHASMRISFRAVNGQATDLHVESFQRLPGEIWSS